MKFSKFIIIPVIIAALACTLQILDQVLMGTGFFITDSGFGWLAFIAWALYFLGGGTVKNGVRGFLGYLSGIVASILIFKLAGWLAPFVGGFWSTPISLLIMVVPIICLERVPWFDWLPAVFIGAGSFFAIMTYVPTVNPEVTYCSAAVTEITYCVIGLLYGWVTIVLRAAYEKSVAKQ